MRLAGDAQRLAARGEDRQRRRRLQQLPGELGAGVHEMLAVVEDQQHAPAPRVSHQRLDHGTPGFLFHSQHRSDRLRDARGLREGRELDQPHAVGEERQHLAAHFQRKARLAGAADAGEGGEARGAERRREVRDLAFAPDEAVDAEGRGCRRSVRLCLLGLRAWRSCAWNGRHRKRRESCAASNLHRGCSLSTRPGQTRSSARPGDDAVAVVDQRQQTPKAGVEHAAALPTSSRRRPTSTD
jgi:hypothetical protein